MAAHAAASAAARDVSPLFTELSLSFDSDSIVSFYKDIGVRYCADKHRWFSATAAYLNYKMEFVVRPCWRFVTAVLDLYYSWHPAAPDVRTTPK